MVKTKWIKFYTNQKQYFAMEYKAKKIYFKRLEQIFETQSLKNLFLFFLTALIAWAGVGSFQLVARGLDIKNKILNIAFVGNGYLAQAKNALAVQDFNTAQTRFSQAYQTFSQGQQQIEKSDKILNWLLSLLPQKRDADRLLQAAALVASAGEDLIGTQNNFQSLKLTPAGLNSQKGSVAEVFTSLNNTLNQASSKITRASTLVSKVNPNNLPSSNRETFNSLKSELAAGQVALNNFNQIFNLAQNLLIGNKIAFILFENNNELRATGGFIGTYGSLKIHDGQINEMTVSSIYDLDGQLNEVIKPPLPILSVNDRWFLRDANWFADFPSSAKKLSSFYEKESGQTPDIIIAMTPNLIVSWLKVTGPIPMPKYGITLTADNFVEQTQAISTISDSLPTNSPKQIFADLVPLLIQKISGSDKKTLEQFIKALEDSLSNKQLVFYAKDDTAETQLQNFHWAGQTLNTDRDYLSVVSSNLGGTKTDLALTQKNNLTTTIKPDGSVINELEITRTNPLPNLPDSTNDSFLRIYVPQGSKLLSSNGFEPKILNYPEDKNYKIDSDISSWEKNSSVDKTSGTTIGRESGKTFFGNWLTVKPGESKTVKLVYQLPYKLSNLDHYSLLLQKQIGSTDQNFTWNLNFAGWGEIWKNFEPKNINTQSLNSDIMLSKDYLFGLVLKKNG